jgi:hypothetical protein
VAREQQLDREARRLVTAAPADEGRGERAELQRIGGLHHHVVEHVHRVGEPVAVADQHAQDVADEAGAGGGARALAADVADRDQEAFGVHREDVVEVAADVGSAAGGQVFGREVETGRHGHRPRQQRLLERLRHGDVRGRALGVLHGERSPPGDVGDEDDVLGGVRPSVGTPDEHRADGGATGTQRHREAVRRCGDADGGRLGFGQLVEQGA